MESKNIKNQLKSYKTEIRLNLDQKKLAAKTFGTVRFIYNFFIKHNKEVYESEKKFISAMSFSKWVNNEFIPISLGKVGVPMYWLDDVYILFKDVNNAGL